MHSYASLIIGLVCHHGRAVQYILAWEFGIMWLWIVTSCLLFKHEGVIMA